MHQPLLETWAETRPVWFFAHDVSLFPKHDVLIATLCSRCYMTFAHSTRTSGACPEQLTITSSNRHSTL